MVYFGGPQALPGGAKPYYILGGPCSAWGGAARWFEE
ncbi:hypothetical protein T10_3155 [Trichinella papuae]|uniref:Uncharacterized protein n=1 Tax=Trichinella papuae TaxID=268474 RepID=A0A0V1LYC8_9BILA|nr:hypothetical protein T10_3155 [Trichinella papuae]